MQLTVKQCFDAMFEEESIKIDKALIDRIYRFHTKFLNQSKEYLSFFAGNYLGVEVVRWRVIDTQRFYSEVLNMDYVYVRKQTRKITTINQEFKVSSDDLNLSLMYLIHRILNSPDLTDKQKERGAYDAALVFFYRALVIRQSEYFHFPASPALAQAAYSALSNKFLIKQLGSWKAVMDYRANDLVNPRAAKSTGGNHYPYLLSFEDDDRVVYMINDSVNAVKSLYKFYYRVFNEVNEQGIKIASTQATQVDTEGVERIKDKTKHPERAIALLRNTLPDPHSFVKDDIVKIICDINTNTSRRMLTQVLHWLSLNHATLQYHKDVDEFISQAVISSYHFIDQMGDGERADLPMVILTLKNLYLSTRTTDAQMIKVRQLAEKLVKQAAGKVNASLVMATRTSLILYITLFTLLLMK